ncbi:MAG: hypothetical protein KDB23_20305, partial [Planctomycetales bacterium]|nr:hypothetical protein [Planctomycetales bacterium]
MVGTLGLSSLTGCTSWHAPNLWHRQQATEAVPHRIVPMWSDTVMYQPGKPGVRGFGARVYFYEEEGANPIRVDGTLTVYAFDANKMSRMPMPEKKFIFTADQLEQHYSKTSIGHSYSLWIPWDEVGGPSRQLSLVTRFEGTHGGTTVSEPARKLLPGLNADEQLADRPANPANARQVSFEQPAIAAADTEETLAAVTIDVPPSFGRKLNQ